MVGWVKGRRSQKQLIDFLGFPEKSRLTMANLFPPVLAESVEKPILKESKGYPLTRLMLA